MTERSPARGRRRWVAWLLGALLVAAALGFGGWLLTLRYPLLVASTPAGALPPPVSVGGAPSGRPGPVTIALAGDAMLGRSVDKRLARRADHQPWALLVQALEGVDLFALNLECALTDHTERWPDKDFAFRLRSDLAPRVLGGFPLPRGAARVVSLANNHALDFGREGLADTVTRLDALGWQHAGAGADATEAQRPALVTTASGVRIGLIAVSDHCSCGDVGQWMAGRDRSGLWYADGRAPDHLLAAVRALDTEVDLVVVSAHWGPNYTERGAPTWLRQAARALVEAGADLVFAHSAHQVMPAEVIDGKHVFYGLGDLMHDYPRRERYDNDLGFVARVRVEADGSQSAELVPYRIEDQVVTPLAPDDPAYATVLRRAEWPG